MNKKKKVFSHADHNSLVVVSMLGSTFQRQFWLLKRKIFIEFKIMKF